MSYDSLLIHRAKVLRRTGQLDRFKQPVRGPGGYEKVHEYACRMNEKSGGEQFSERSRDVISENTTVFLPPNADVREDDQLEIYDPRNGYALVKDGNVTQVRRVYGMGQEHHREVSLTTIRGSGTGGEDG